jgi:ketosteroid isomerase-like protein
MNAEDRQAILDLIAQYGYTWDANDVEGFCALFHDDAVINLYVPGQATPVHTHQANSDRRAYIQSRWEALAAQGIQPRHYQLNTVLTEVSPGLVRGQLMILLTHQYPGEAVPRVVVTGIYRDEFRRTAEGWKFARRDQYIDAGYPQVRG